nr:immunoglobulin light chain junction region [Macaca mulatta]
CMQCLEFPPFTF